MNVIEAVDIIKGVINERADDHGENSWEQVMEAWRLIVAVSLPPTEADQITDINRKLSDIDCALSEIVSDYQDRAEEEPGFDSHFKDDETGRPLCVPEDANPELDGVRVLIDEAMTQLAEYRNALDKPDVTDELGQALEGMPDDIAEAEAEEACDTCGAPAGETHPPACADTIERESKIKNVTKTFFGCYDVELDIDYDGSDLVSSCIIIKGDYSSSLAKATCEGTLDHCRTGEEILIPERVVNCIHSWAEENGY